MGGLLTGYFTEGYLPKGAGETGAGLPSITVRQRAAQMECRVHACRRSHLGSRIFVAIDDANGCGRPKATRWETPPSPGRTDASSGEGLAATPAVRDRAVQCVAPIRARPALWPPLLPVSRRERVVQDLPQQVALVPGAVARRPSPLPGLGPARRVGRSALRPQGRGYHCRHGGGRHDCSQTPASVAS